MDALLCDLGMREEILSDDLCALLGEGLLDLCATTRANMGLDDQTVVGVVLELLRRLQDVFLKLGIHL